MGFEGWFMLAVGVIACLGFSVSWAAWISAHEANSGLSDLRYKLRRELGSDGL